MAVPSPSLRLKNVGTRMFSLPDYPGLLIWGLSEQKWSLETKGDHPRADQWIREQGLGGMYPTKGALLEALDAALRSSVLPPLPALLPVERTSEEQAELEA
jgi:hypothetical protein